MPLLLCLLLAVPAPPQEGTLPPWEAKPFLTNTEKQIRALTDALNVLDTGHWKGDYGPLLVSTRQRVAAVADAVDRMAQKPDSLALGVEAFLSLQHVEDNLESLTRGAERFQPTAVKNLEAATGSFQQVKEGFQGYLLDLARYLEKSVAVSTKDLEGCREQLWKRAPAPRKN